MNRNLILKTDILDIIFENRNKAYGAYSLRKLYPHRLKLALGFMLLFAAALSAFTFLPGKDHSVIVKPHIIDHEFSNVKPKDEPKKPEVKKPEIKKPDQVKVDPKPVVGNQTKLTNNIAIVKDRSDSIVTLLPTDVISTVTVNMPSGPPKVLVPPTPPAAPAPPAGPKVDINSPLDGSAVDIMPSFPGGMAALQRFLEKNLYNPYDQENGATVQVKVKFVVGYNGKLQRFETVQDGGDVYNKEVVRVLKKMPDWEPGKARGENVSVYYTIPVKFVMSN